MDILSIILSVIVATLFYAIYKSDHNLQQAQQTLDTAIEQSNEALDRLYQSQLQTEEAYEMATKAHERTKMAHKQTDDAYEIVTGYKDIIEKYQGINAQRDLMTDDTNVTFH